MIRRRVPQELWDYSIRWVSETTSIIHSSEGEIEGAVPLTKVTRETSDISEYLYFGSYEKILFKENAWGLTFLTWSLVGIFSMHWTLDVLSCIKPKGHSDIMFNRSKGH